MPLLAMGLMSGTSCDGVSAALGVFQGRRVTVLAERTFPYSKKLSRTLQRSLTLTTPEISRLHMELGGIFAHAALRLLRTARVPATRLTVIGSHGQTIYHGPRDAIPSTLQIGAPAVIAHLLGVPVVADFRARDMAAGGEGAPLIPFFDEAFFGGGPMRALQNIGGIANVTVVGKGRVPCAFDTGPGNCWIDTAARLMSRGRISYDASGHLACTGRIDHRFVAQLWRHPYFHATPPKSTGRELFSETLLRQTFGARLRTTPRDVLATVTYFTAYSIAESYRRFVPIRLREVIASGGGVRNRTLMDHLTRLLAPVPVHSIERYGIPAQAKEPLAFAFLALRAWQGRINHVPAATGATQACVLGSLTHARPRA